MAHPATVAALTDLAEEQWGLFTRRQADATGMAWTTLSRLARDGAAERIAHGVYRLRGAPPPDDLFLLAAWLQLAPNTPVWERSPSLGVVSHRSAAALYDLGHLIADVHQFTVPVRRQSRRPDVRLHRAELRPEEWTRVRGLLVTRPARTAADLLGDHEDPQAVGYVVADALRRDQETPGRVAAAIRPYAGRFGLVPHDGEALLHWLLDLTGDPERDRWLAEAHAAVDGDGTTGEPDRIQP